MKKSEVISKLASVIINFNLANREDALKVAKVILEVQEDFDLLNPKHKKIKTYFDIENMPYEDYVEVEGWEPE